MRPADYRVATFSGADQAVQILRWGATIPSNSPYEVKLPELPREDDPTTLLVRQTGAVTNIQPDGTAGIDTYLDEAAPTTNYGTTAYTRVGTAAGGQKARDYTKFDVTSGPTTAEKVVMRKYLETAGGSAQTFGVHKLTSAPTEASDTWNSPPTHDLVAEDTTIVYGAGWYEFDVTTWYNAVKAGSITNHGLMLKHTNEATANTQRQFTSSDGSASQRPVLRITAQGNVFSEVAEATTPAALEVRCKYSRGILGFNAADAGKSILVDLYGRGSPVAAKDVGAYTRYLGSGADGELNVLTGTTTLTGGIYSYTRIYIAPGATLTISGPHTCVIGCTGDVEIYGTINLDGKGGAGGTGGGSYQNGLPGQGFGATGGRGGGGGYPAISVTVNSTPVSPSVLGSITMDLLFYLAWNNDSAGDPFASGLAAMNNAANTVLNFYRTANNEAGLVTLLTGGYGAMPGFLRSNTAGQNSALQSWLESQDGTSAYGGVSAIADYLKTAYDSSSVTNVAALPVSGGGGGGSLNRGSNGTDGGGNQGGAGGEKHVVTSDGIEEFVRPLPGGGGGGAGGDASAGGAGGAGGGALLLQVEGELLLDGNAVLTALGAAAAGTNGGGGGGGVFHVRCNRRTTNSVVPVVTGGAGNGRGGNGSAGWYLIEDLESAV